ncbi:MFS transporter [uncultured Megasphaera sp.]|uniref:MFS transporter n=1 Tax=uncultured Megasphaera sp. TaxID=165188 RepID=UPI0025DDDD08|nr:MFS transporter [uncultured Megasphaera sp.]
MEFAVEKSQEFRSFLNRLTLLGGGTNFLDGYILACIGPALVHLGPILQLNSFWKGAIGSAALMGILVGAPIFGYLSDKVGRKLPFMVIPLAMAILSIASMFVTSAEMLFVCRFLLGMVIGADYPSVTSYLSEYSPADRRGYVIGVLMIMWIAGMTLGEIVGYIVYDSAYNWQILLGITAVPALALIYLRRNCPESPRWLMNKNRVAEAETVFHKIYGPDADISILEEKAVKTSYRELLKPRYLKRVIFAGVFWATQVLPMFAIYIFGPSLLQEIGLTEGRDLLLGNSVIGMIFVVGVVFGAVIIERFGRRPLIIWSFVGMALGLFVFGIMEEPPFWLIVTGFTLYAIASGPANVLDWVYPNELFPTEIRAAGVGLATFISRFGPILGTFALPSYLEAFGIQMTMMTMVGILGIGLLACIFMAPETRGLNLSEASGAVPIGTEELVREEIQSHQMN